MYVRPVAGDCPLIASAADDAAKLASAAGDVPNTLDGGGACWAGANRSTRVTVCDGPSGPDQSDLCGPRVARIAAQVLHDMGSHSYVPHDVCAPVPLEHNVAHAPITDYRDKPGLIYGGVEGPESLGMSGCCSTESEHSGDGDCHD